VCFTITKFSPQII